MSLHPNLEPLAPLVGTWRGSARGEYPTITSFTYTDAWQFIDVGKPFLLFVERTWNAEGAPMHTETGYVRSPGGGVVWRVVQVVVGTLIGAWATPVAAQAVTGMLPAALAGMEALRYPLAWAIGWGGLRLGYRPEKMP